MPINLQATESRPGRLCFLAFAFSLLLITGAAAAETIWQGQSSNWFDPANWSDGVPDATTNVRIPDISASRPQINNGMAEVGHLQIDALGLRISNGATLQAASVTSRMREDLIADGIYVTGAGSELRVSGDMRLGTELISLAFFQGTFLQIQNGGLVHVMGNLRLGDLSGFPSSRSSANIFLSGANSMLAVDGDMELAIWSGGLYVWSAGTVRVGGRFTIASQPQGNTDRPTAIEIGQVSQAPPGAPIRFDLTADDPTIEWVNELSLNEFVFMHTDDEYRLENSAGVPISLRGQMEVLHRTEAHTIADGHHQFPVWRIEAGSSEFNGSVDGLVELLQGLHLYGGGEIARVQSTGTVQPGTRTETGTMRITESFQQIGPGMTNFRVQSDGFDRLVSETTLDFQGGSIRITIDEDAQAGEYSLIHADIGFIAFFAPVEIINHGYLRAETTQTANELRLELRRFGELSVDASSLEFGSVALGEFSEQPLALENIGESDIQLNFQPFAENAFSLSGGSCPLQFAFLLAPGQSCSVTVRFQPDRGGEINDQFSIQVPNEGQSETVELRGQGDAGPDIFSDRFELEVPE